MGENIYALEQTKKIIFFISKKHARKKIKTRKNKLNSNIKNEK